MPKKPRTPGGPRVRVRRVYDPPEPQDGTRVLVDRLWPRGMSKQAAALDEWARQAAPSPGLRRWYGHEPGRFAEFRRRYRAELAGGGPAGARDTATEQADAVDHLRELAHRAPLTLLTATGDLDGAAATVLAELLTASDGGGPGPRRR